MSRKALDILMWAHYADFHRGFLVEFKIPVEEYGQRISESYEEYLVPQPVNYVDNRPVYKIAINDYSDSFENIYLSKSKDWSYESEERVISRSRGPGIHKYKRNEILCSVIAGIKMESKNFQLLKNDIQEINDSCGLNVDLYQAVQSVNEYKLLVPKHPRLENGEYNVVLGKR